MPLLRDAAPEWLHEQMTTALDDELGYTLQSPVLSEWWDSPGRVTAKFTILDNGNLSPSAVTAEVGSVIPSVYEHAGVTYEATSEVSYEPPTASYPAHGDVSVVVSFTPRSAVGSFSHRQA